MMRVGRSVELDGLAEPSVQLQVPEVVASPLAESSDPQAESATRDRSTAPTAPHRRARRLQPHPASVGDQVRVTEH